MKHHGKRAKREVRSERRSRRELFPNLEDLGDEEPDFDLELWRRDLMERSAHRERMRARDLRRGVLRSVRRLPRIDEDEDDF
jgi:hypothetical protein